ncbi:adipokinetic hormone/corazonin-related peptide receptor variant I-like [Crassostrea angulata]|uniref:Adipokinetic hormone receptor 2 n=1 Tax=Magallana gigas TaxID=29159 RepID=A0A1C6ZYI1_MAGGI|nr:gonadotropin-releasing hormone II receptor [Crassostrea gigas]XP_052701813.1 adipokinetic hormone/corazonin-related peptide receptor variant I-like [Crassostrea angulata]AKA95276.1 adipokinetic hormone receptor 2 [Crassostrea gigas]|eukprot:XP_011441976.1 PREDICTED: gonadotropin-releasing hormone II receptor [Crassostrea gigas]
MNLTYSYQFTDLSEVEKVETTMKIMNTTVGTGSGNMSDKGLPREMTFNDDNVMSVIAYACLFLFAASGNLTVLVTLLKSRRYKSRVNTFIMHLSIADLIVAFIMLPLETAWHVTVAWEAGDAACRILMFFRALGFYLSSFVLVAISLDRYFSIVHPLSIHDADRRGKIMLTMAWLLSIIASLPQSIIFHVERHPLFTWFEQCVTFNFFPTEQHELAYNLFNVITVYLLPLVIITTSYSLILYKVSKTARRDEEERREFGLYTHRSHTYPLSRSGLISCTRAGIIGKARIRTLKMTLVIVTVFVLCWTPYFLMVSWFWIDRESAKNIDTKVQRGLFIFAVSSACLDPIVYGMFTAAFRKEARRWLGWFKDRLNRMGIYTMTPNTASEQDNFK